VANAAGGKPVGAAQFTQAAGDGVAVEASDTGHKRDAAFAVLLRQQAGELAATAFIGPDDKAVDGAVGARRGTVGVAQAVRTLAAVQFSSGLALAPCLALAHSALPRSD
jgi:hypothetical protein